MTGCEWLKCKWWNGRCMDPAEYVRSDTGEPCCGMRDDAVPVLPKSRLRAVEKCLHCTDGWEGKFIKGSWSAPCTFCHGTGTIERDATLEEIIEVAEWAVENNYDVLLRSGARIMLKRGD